ncbi:MAG: hypothetical protein LBV22_02990 [Mycoplasmataceae bacterium]|jgi:hypothetical protein|nr:hypothetical protein [Mycoplasmataceae bacterium]
MAEFDNNKDNNQQVPPASDDFDDEVTPTPEASQINKQNVSEDMQDLENDFDDIPPPPPARDVFAKDVSPLIDDDDDLDETPIDPVPPPLAHHVNTQPHYQQPQQQPNRVSPPPPAPSAAAPSGKTSFVQTPSFSYSPADTYAETQKSISTTAKKIAELNALKTEELVEAKKQFDEAVYKINNIAEETKAAAEHKRALELKNAKDEFEVALLNTEKKFS